MDKADAKVGMTVQFEIDDNFRSAAKLRKKYGAVHCGTITKLGRKFAHVDANDGTGFYVLYEVIEEVEGGLLSVDEAIAKLDEMNPARAAFRRAWNRLADFGTCDGWGGMECLRVWDEWLEAGLPPDVEAFIAERANIGPEK